MKELRFNLQAKFILIATTIILSLTILIGYLSVQRERAIFTEEVSRQGKLLAETLAIPIVNDMIYEKLGLVEEGGLLDTYIMEIYNKKDIDLDYIMILDENGKVVSHNNLEEYGKKYENPVGMKDDSSSGTVLQRYRDNKTGHFILDVATPLSIGKKRWGVLRFGISLEKAEHEILNTIVKIVVLSSAILLLSFFTIILLSRRFIKPITELAVTMEKASGEFLDVKVKIQGKDELAALGEKFNSMIERIKQANEELKKTYDKLAQSEKLASLGILAAGIAHEINNPLGGLFISLDMLQSRGEEKAFRKEYLDLVREGLEKIENIVGKLLWVSRSNDGKANLVSVEAVVQECLPLIDYQLRKNNIRLHREEDSGRLLMIERSDLQQLMLNLFINAIQAMPEGGELSVITSETDSKVAIRVQDTGQGISQEDLPRIFDPFFTTKAPGEGTGLGLWLCYEMMKKYSGEVDVKSSPGVGTTFTLYFPKIS